MDFELLIKEPELIEILHQDAHIARGEDDPIYCRELVMHAYQSWARDRLLKQTGESAQNARTCTLASAYSSMLHSPDAAMVASCSTRKKASHDC